MMEFNLFGLTTMCGRRSSMNAFGVWLFRIHTPGIMAALFLFEVQFHRNGKRLIAFDFLFLYGIFKAILREIELRRLMKNNKESI